MDVYEALKALKEGKIVQAGEGEEARFMFKFTGPFSSIEVDYYKYIDADFYRASGELNFNEIDLYSCRSFQIDDIAKNAFKVVTEAEVKALMIDLHNKNRSTP